MGGEYAKEQRPASKVRASYVRTHIAGHNRVARRELTEAQPKVDEFMEQLIRGLRRRFRYEIPNLVEIGDCGVR